MRFLHGAGLLLALFFAGSALADGYVEEWRVLGVAQSWHSNTQTARLRAVSSSFDCRTAAYLPPGKSEGDAQGSGIPSMVCPALNDQDAGAIEQYRPVVDASHRISCTEVPFAGTDAGLPLVRAPIEYRVCHETVYGAQRHYDSTDPGLGVQYARRFDDHVIKAFAMVIRDSNGQGSVMAGAAYQWPLLEAGTLTIDGGFGAALWYRSLVDADGETLHRSLVPALFPALSITEHATGLGIDAIVAPKLSFEHRGKHYAMPTTVSAQLTWLVHETSHNTERLSVEPSASGVRLNYIATF